MRIHAAIYGAGMYLDGPDKPITETDTYDIAYTCSSSCMTDNLRVNGYEPTSEAGVTLVRKSRVPR